MHWVFASRSSPVGLSIHGADVGQMAVFLGVVGAVTDYEYIADREPDEIQRDLDLAPLRFVEQRACPKILTPRWRSLPAA